MRHILKAKPLAAVFFFLVVSTPIFGQTTFRTSSNDLALEKILDFAANREKFSRFACRMEASSQLFSNTVEGDKNIEWFVIEEKGGKLRRTDTHRSQLGTSIGGDFASDSLFGTAISNGDKQFFALSQPGGTAEEYKAKIVKFHFAPDPWMLALSELNSVSTGHAALEGEWINFQDESGLLWTEENDNMIRAEWNRKIPGVAMCHIQVYFSKRDGGMPVLVRYLIPLSGDEKKRFVAKGRIFVSENEIRWMKLKHGFVPAKMHFNRVDYYESKIGVKFTQSQDVDFQWQSTFWDQDSESIKEEVFDFKKTDVARLLKAFSSR